MLILEITVEDDENNITMRWNYSLTNCDFMFYELSNITKINLSQFDTSKVSSMISMFDGCTSLTLIDLNNLNTSLVENLDSLFNECISLISLDLSSFDTSKVTDMQFMFSGCNSLISLNIKNFKTSSVTNMSCLFQDCNLLKSLNLNNFNTSKVMNMDNLFFNCFSLTSLYINNFDTKSLTSMENMFYQCYSLISLNLSNFNTLKVTNMDCMFTYCHSLLILDLINFDMTNVIKMNELFRECKSLISLKINNFYVSTIAEINDIFKDCNNLLVYCFNNISDRISGQLINYKNNNCSHLCFSQFKKIDFEKKECVNYLQTNKFDYNNICYNSCPNGTHLSYNYNNNHLCEEDLICEKYYNYNQTDCLYDIPDGYFLNNSILKTIDKCNIKCKKCTLESMMYNACISCDIDNYYYPKFNNSNNNSFIDCYNFNTISDGYFLDKNDNSFKLFFFKLQKM